MGSYLREAEIMAQLQGNTNLNFGKVYVLGDGQGGQWHLTPSLPHGITHQQDRRTVFLSFGC